MNRDDIIRMAQEADCPIGPQMLKFYERFAALVAAEEREACANICEESNDMGSSYGLAQAIRARGQA